MFIEISSNRLGFLSAVLIPQRQESDEIIFAEMVAVLTEKLTHEPLFLSEFHEIPHVHESIWVAHSNLHTQRFSEAGTTTSGVQPELDSSY
jgi:hypothetical protein